MNFSGQMVFYLVSFRIFFFDKKKYKIVVSYNSFCFRNSFVVICDIFFLKYNLICKFFFVDLISVIIFFYFFCVVWKEDGECIN